MLDLELNERIDWFRIVADLRKVGVSRSVVCKELDIPRSTLQGWCDQIGNPRLEPGMRLINYWCKKCGRKVEETPVHNPYNPFPPPLPVVKTNEKPAAKPLKNPPQHVGDDDQLEMRF